MKELLTILALPTESWTLHPGHKGRELYLLFSLAAELACALSSAQLTVALLFGAASTISSLRIALFESSRLDIAIKMLLPSQFALHMLLY